MRLWTFNDYIHFAHYMQYLARTDGQEVTIHAVGDTSFLQVPITDKECVCISIEPELKAALEEHHRVVTPQSPRDTLGRASP